MKVGIVGLANCGRTTIFNALTGQSVPVTEYSSLDAAHNVGTVKVPDSRVDTLAGIFQPRKVTWATVEFVDVAGIEQAAIAGRLIRQGVLDELETAAAQVLELRHREIALGPVDDGMRNDGARHFLEHVLAAPIDLVAGRDARS